MAKIQLDIKNCLICPFVKRERRRTEDGSETIHDYSCWIKNRTIANNIKYPRDEMPDVPHWCPYLVEEN